MSISVAKQIKKGTVFFEQGYGEELQLTALTTPVRYPEGKWEWEAVTSTGQSVHYLITEGYEHYGPKISLERMYG